MAETTLMYKAEGSRVSLVVPLELNEDGKYQLPAVVNKYIFDFISKGSGFKIPKPDSSTSEDTYKSLADTANNTFRVKIYPKTLTYSNGALIEEAGSGTTAVYAEVTITAGNTPLLKAGTAEAVRCSIVQFINAQKEWQKSPCLVVQHIGKMLGASTPAGFTYCIGKLTSDVTDTEEGSTKEGDLLAFTAGSYELDSTLDLVAVNGAFEAMTPFGSSAAITVTALAADDLTALKAGELVVKG